MRARDIKPGFFKNDQLAECSMAARLLFPGLWMLADREGRLAIAVTLFPPDRRRYDLDNRLKAVLDSLTEARVWEDDRYVKIIHLEEGGIVKGGACRVCIAPAPDQVALLDAYGRDD